MNTGGRSLLAFTIKQPADVFNGPRRQEPGAKYAQQTSNLSWILTHLGVLGARSARAQSPGLLTHFSFAKRISSDEISVYA
jgi:hypothetical protein